MRQHSAEEFLESLNVCFTVLKQGFVELRNIEQSNQLRADFEAAKDHRQVRKTIAGCSPGWRMHQHSFFVR